jgi:DNA primase
MTIDLRLAFVRAPPSNSQPVFVRCQEHRDRTPSLAVYPDGLYCFGCGFQKQNLQAAVRYLDQFEMNLDSIYQGSTYQKDKQVEVVGDLPNSLADLYCHFLFEHRRDSLEFLHKRTLTDESIRTFRIGHDGTRYVIPIFKWDSSRGEVLGTLRYRLDPLYALPEDTRYTGTKGRNQLAVYPEWVHNQETRNYRVVVESELCAIRLWQDNIPAICVTNGAKNLHKLVDLLTPYEWIDTLHIASDMDAAGTDAYEKLQMTNQSRFKIRPVCWNRQMGKDPTEIAQRDSEQFKRIFWKYQEA